MERNVGIGCEVAKGRWGSDAMIGNIGSVLQTFGVVPYPAEKINMLSVLKVY